MDTKTQRNVGIGASIALGVMCFWDKGRQTAKSWIGIEEKIHVVVKADGETSTAEVS